VVLERLVLVAELLVEKLDLQHVPDPEQGLVDVERLRKEVVRPACQSPLPRLAGCVPRENEDRDVRAPGQQQLQRSHDLEPVDVRHQQVEEDQIGLELSDQVRDLARVGGALDVPIPGLPQGPLQQADVGLLVVHDEDARTGLPRVAPHPQVPSVRDSSTGRRASFTPGLAAGPRADTPTGDPRPGGAGWAPEKIVRRL